jgi:hypothetical protein
VNGSQGTFTILTTGMTLSDVLAKSTEQLRRDQYGNGHDRAHEPYNALFGPVDDPTKGKRLLIVDAFVTGCQGGGRSGFRRYRGAAWLGTCVPMAMRPSVVALKALRHADSGAAPPQSGVKIGRAVTHSARRGASRRANTPARSYGTQRALWSAGH